jgi:hypothetical protein
MSDHPVCAHCRTTLMGDNWNSRTERILDTGHNAECDSPNGLEAGASGLKRLVAQRGRSICGYPPALGITQ